MELDTSKPIAKSDRVQRVKTSVREVLVPGRLFSAPMDEKPLNEQEQQVESICPCGVGDKTTARCIGGKANAQDQNEQGGKRLGHSQRPLFLYSFGGGPVSGPGEGEDSAGGPGGGEFWSGSGGLTLRRGGGA
jgi:hypothetical protein